MRPNVKRKITRSESQNPKRMKPEPKFSLKQDAETSGVQVPALLPLLDRARQLLAILSEPQSDPGRSSEDASISNDCHPSTSSDFPSSPTPLVIPDNSTTSRGYGLQSLSNIPLHRIKQYPVTSVVSSSVDTASRNAQRQRISNVQNATFSQSYTQVSESSYSSRSAVDGRVNVSGTHRRARKD